MDYLICTHLTVTLSNAMFHIYLQKAVLMSEITTVRKEEPSATVTNGNSDSTEILWIFQRRVFWFAH